MIVFEIYSNSYQFYNGIIVTKDGEEPDGKGLYRPKNIAKIEDNVYYFEAE